MKTFLKLLVFAGILLPVITIAKDKVSKDCNCEEKYRWVRKTFEENDAGFAYGLEQKGKDSYEAHNRKFEKRIKTIKNYQECFNALYDWLKFFRAGHIAIRPKINTNNGNSSISKEDIIKKFKGWEKVDMSETKLKQRLSNLKNPGYEGIWVSSPYRIGIVKKGKGYVGYILKADGVYWRQGQVKLKIEPSKTKGQFKATFFMRDHSAENFDNIRLLDNKILTMGFITLQRENASFTGNLALALKMATTNTPFVKRLSDKTMLLRIPSFLGSNKKLIDSVLNAHHQEITSTENLIIDIKNGTGGSDNAYYGILPYLYTNPIRTVGVELLSTPLNNTRMENFAKRPNISQGDKAWVEQSLQKLRANPGKFVNLNNTGNKVSIRTYDKVYEYPKNIAIVINRGNGSTDEQFLLAAKQSRKVKLFGATTFGVLDISNMHFVDSPCKHFQLGYCLSKSYRIPAMAIDGKGIQPDYMIDQDLHEFEWLGVVQKAVESWK